MHAVKFFSQRGRVHESVGCGAASLMMLLRHHSPPIQIPSYRDLCECLWLTVDPEIKGHERRYGKGAYGTDVERALKGMVSTEDDYAKIEGTPESALRRLRKALTSGPVMTAMKGKGFGAGEGHWIVITGLQDGEVIYLDPWLRHREKRSLSPTDFRKHWDECAFFLKHRCKCNL